MQHLKYTLPLFGALAVLSPLGASGDVMELTAGSTGRVAVEKDVTVEGVRVDIASPGNKVNGGQLHVYGPGRITVGAGGVKDVTRQGRYCVFHCPIAFAADQAIDCTGREQMYFYGQLSDVDPGSPAKIVKRGHRPLYLGEGATNSTFSGSLRVEQGGICFLAKDCLGSKGGIVLANDGFLWYGGGSNARDVTVEESNKVDGCLRAESWGPKSEQSGRLTFRGKTARIRVAGGRTLTLSGGALIEKKGHVAFNLRKEGLLVLSGKSWTGAGTVEFSGAGAVELKGDRVLDDSALDMVVGEGIVVRLNGTEQRFGALTVKKGATVLGPGTLVTGNGTIDLPEGGKIGGAAPKDVPKVDWSKPVRIGGRLQLLWDDDIADVSKTTAARLMHRAQLAGTVHVFEKPWEGDCCFYQALVKAEDGLRIYYKACGSRLVDKYSPGKFKRHGKSYCSYIRSTDGGMTWTYPDFNRVEVNGSRHNNVFLEESRDNFFVFRDTNPACPPEERYKALTMWGYFNSKGMVDRSKAIPGLWCYVSTDGNTFRRDRLASNKGAFDTLNTAFWDAERGVYHAYVRGFHGSSTDRNGDRSIRDIRHMVSKDFKTWSVPKMLDFGPDRENYPLYTNGIHPYYREPSVFIGFPARYVERKDWTDNFEKLCAADKRKDRMKVLRRGGLTTWDTVFCFSRDGQRFDRFDEAFIRPGPEHPDKNWAYADTMVTVGDVETPGRFGTDPEISMFVLEGAHLGVPCKLNRYTVRLDGFVSRNAPYAGARFVTRPLVFDGSEMVLNFSTSARGFVYVTMRDEAGNVLKSTELFGDKVDRVVGWEGGSPKTFAGKPVTLTFDMSDADIYSFRFR